MQGFNAGCAHIFYTLMPHHLDDCINAYTCESAILWMSHLQTQHTTAMIFFQTSARPHTLIISLEVRPPMWQACTCETALRCNDPAFLQSTIYTLFGKLWKGLFRWISQSMAINPDNNSGSQSVVHRPQGVRITHKTSPCTIHTTKTTIKIIQISWLGFWTTVLS